MNTNNVLQNAVYRAVDQINEQLPSQKKLVKSPDTPLIGESSELDSLTLISLIVAVEESIETNYGKSISLSDDDSILTDASGPLASMNSLAEYLSGQIQQ